MDLHAIREERQRFIHLIIQPLAVPADDGERDEPTVSSLGSDMILLTIYGVLSDADPGLVPN